MCDISADPTDEDWDAELEQDEDRELSVKPGSKADSKARGKKAATTLSPARSDQTSSKPNSRY